MREVLENPQNYFDTGLSPGEFNLFLMHTLLITSCGLLSYVVFLILSAKTRAELVAGMMTESLNLSLEQMMKMYEDAPVPYITLDKKGNIIDPNKAALRFFEVLPKEIEGKNLFYYQPEEDLSKSEKLLQYYESNIPINREEVRMITKNGKTKWVLLSVFRMEGPVKKGKVGLATIFDVTEEKELDKAKTEFVSLASHQLRTPTATTKWFLDMLLSGDLGDLNEKQADYLKRIGKVNENMIDLVETLLNVSRVEIGSLSTESKETDVAKIIESVLLEMSNQIESKNLNILKRYGGNLRDIKTDPKLLRIVIHNILSNSIKYTLPSGTISITLKESFGEKSIIVSDTGIGIPEAEKNMIFNKLFRAGNARKLDESEGTGLGLYLVKSIIEALGGSIGFESEENKGSTFTIKL
jgi:PAS domain S-box-containing protein